MTLQHRLELWLARALLAVLRALGPVRASNLAGAFARTVGPLLPVSRIADVNLRLALPQLDRAARRRVVRGVWDNLGRTVGELPHLGSLPQGRLPGPSWYIEGGERIDALAARGGPGILFSGHLGNWELMPVACAFHGVPVASFYRAADNPAVDALMAELRLAATGGRSFLFPKGQTGSRQAMAHLAKGGFLGVLFDQKMNDGVEARLFGRPTMTASGLAAMALRLRCPLVPGYVERLGPARFRLIAEDALPLPDTGDHAADVLALTQAMNDRLEAWVRRKPESWLWLHRRWNKVLYN